MFFLSIYKKIPNQYVQQTNQQDSTLLKEKSTPFKQNS